MYSNKGMVQQKYWSARSFYRLNSKNYIFLLMIWQEIYILTFYAPITDILKYLQ